MNIEVPDKATEERDQAAFDQAVNSKGKTVLAALAGVGIVAAMLMSMVALVKSGERSEPRLNAQTTPTIKQAAAVVAPPAATKPVSLSIIGSYKRGPDGKLHDAFTKTEFAVKVGQALKLKITNTDDVPHSITAPTAGVNIAAQPGTHTYTLVVKEAGKFQWYCMIPCDSDAHGWAMRNPGYMSGYITAT
jgi:plastocyanin